MNSIWDVTIVMIRFEYAKFSSAMTKLQIVQFLQNLAKTHPDFIGYATIGKTFEGRELAMLKANLFEYNIYFLIKMGYPAENGASKPVFLVDGGIHAREWIAPAVALHLINAVIKLLF